MASNRGAYLAALLGGFAKGAGEQIDKREEYNRRIGELLLAKQAKAESEKMDKEREQTQLRLSALKAMQGSTYLDPQTGRTISQPGIAQSTIETQFPGLLLAAQGQPALPPVNVGPGKTSLIPEGKTGVELKKASELGNSVFDSTREIRSLLTKNPGILRELKIIRNDPTGFYEQTGASAETKQAIANLRLAAANRLYLKSGATANPGEYQESLKNFMAQISDNPEDFAKRLDLLDREVQGYIKNPARTKTSSNGLTPDEEAELNRLVPGATILRIR